ncbi:MAG: hypothetical protein CVV18_00600 [Gammaproteobacteria bacterium HGW-Gammaproteobacteria-8]|nr:MAG: hypothetical protein CVV18_00600 [Gammaproteobacteria bacterium HGW-Gammaproteobacteria-8]
MHAKVRQITKFLEDALLRIIREAFGEAGNARKQAVDTPQSGHPSEWGPRSKLDMIFVTLDSIHRDR